MNYLYFGDDPDVLKQLKDEKPQSYNLLPLFSLTSLQELKFLPKHYGNIYLYTALKPGHVVCTYQIN